MRHAYTAGCTCKRCVRELERRTAQAATVKPSPFYVPTGYRPSRRRKSTRRPVWGSAEWAETRGDDLGESEE